MTSKKKPVKKTYTLKLPRPQYDRVCETFPLTESSFQSFNFEEDAVTFKITDDQREKWTENYYISQMFLPENIGSYTV